MLDERKTKGQLITELCELRQRLIISEEEQKKLKLSITEQKRAENIMQARLRLLKIGELHSLEEFTQATLDESEALTGSTIGFYHLVEADQRTLSLQSWSTNTLQHMCTAAGRGQHYDVAEAGVWVDCVHQRRPVIHNSYDALPYRKGMPPGHAPVVRELIVPIFRADKIVAIIGVGNKSSDYDEWDVEAISLLGDLSWDITERKRAEEALRKSRAQLQTVFDNLTAGVVVSTLDGHLLTWNQAAMEMYGYSSLEEVRHSVADFADTFEIKTLDGEVLPLEQWPLSRILRGERLRNLEVRVRRQDQGWERIYNYGGALVRDQDGSPLLGIVSMTDITANKQAEREIQRLATFPQMNPQPVLEMNIDGRISYYNQAALEALGKMGQVEDLKNFLPGDLQEILAIAEQTGERHFQREVEVNGAVFLANIYFTAQFNTVRLYAVNITDRKRAEEALRRWNEELELRVRDRTTELEDTVAQLEEEMSDRQQAEWQAASLGRLYRLLSRVYEVIVHAQDQEELFLQASRIMMEEGDFLLCWIGRVDWEAGLIRAAAQFDHVDDYSESVAVSLEDVPEGRGPTGVAVREGRWDVCLDIAGDPRMAPWRGQALARGFRSSAAFPLFVGGRVEGVFSLYSGQKGFFNKEEVAVLNSLAQDLSFAMESMDREAKRQQAEEEIRRLNEELEQRVKARTAELEFANRELEAFAYSVSHDLKAPLRAIQGFSRMLSREHAARLDDEGLRRLNVIVDNTQVMDRLIDDLLALSRLGRQQLRKSQVNLAVMARQVFEQLQIQGLDRDLRLIVPDLPPAWGDHSLLNQVMMNLLGNAIKYTRVKKTAAVELDGHAEGRETIYSIKDNGVGFDERFAHKLFGVFQRLHGGPEYEGTGVGLAIVQRIIHRHGGRVWAEGKVGEGATFYFALPQKED